MSASVATPMAGLPNYDFSPDNMPDFTATEFPDSMEVDRPTEPENKHNNHDESALAAQRPGSGHTAISKTSSEAQKEALGNLLGALIPQQDEQGGEVPIPNVPENAFSAVEDLPDAPQQAQFSDNANYDHSRLPSFDATAANDLFTAEELANLEQTMNIPHTPIDQGMPAPSMAHCRQDSMASLGSLPKRPTTPQQREFEAFARLQFEDGSYYLNTYSCELGRDVLAYRAALQKEREEKEAEMNGNGKSRSTSGRASQRSGLIRRQLGSQVQGSVVSEQGGFAGIDEPPMRPPPNPDKPTMSSQESESSVVKPAEYLINPRTMPSFDYHRSTEMQAKWTAQEENEGAAPDDEEPAAVTAAHLPNPHMCPLIPIHGKPKDGQTDAELHKKISRRHVKIQWNFEHDRWELKVQGRNGAFADDKFVRWKGVVPLHDGSIIQIAHVVLTFRLPNTAPKLEQLQPMPMDVDADEALPSVERRTSESVAGSERRASVIDNKSTPKISLKLTQKSEATPPELPLGPDGLPIVKRRGPGRPPKDGIMSTRERKEREKAAKLAAMRDANGGRTPPPSMRPKLPKLSPPVVEEIKVEPKPEKRKYTKRRMTDENGNPIPDADGEGEDGDIASDGEPKTKKARAQREKSESPEYPPKESLTAEQLARPPESYAQLLYKILTELYPRALPLKDIYRELKMRYPWYVYEAQTEGWQSSVRHNLNSEFGKLFDKGDKEGKGFAWRAIPNAQLPQTEKKRTTQPPAQRPRPQPPQQRPAFQPVPGQNIQWQGTGAFPANGGPQPFTNPGQWPQPGAPDSNWSQGSGSLPGGQQPGGPQKLPGSVQAQNTQPGLPQINGAAGPGPVPGGAPAPPPPAPAAAPSFSSAASNMPCTLDGVEAIKRFEVEMYRQMGVDEGVPEKREFWQSVFASAKKRILHGYPTSTRPEGDSKAEATIMSHMKSFVSRFANPNFKGFKPRTAPDGANVQHSATPPTQVTTPMASPAASNGPPVVAIPPVVTTIEQKQSPTLATLPVAAEETAKMEAQSQPQVTAEASQPQPFKQEDGAKASVEEVA